MGKVVRRDFRRRERISSRPVPHGRKVSAGALQGLYFTMILICLFGGAVGLLLRSQQTEVTSDGGATHMSVFDGDTVETSEGVFRLVGYNTPELHGDCSEERALARRARDRLRALVTGGAASLRRVPCACPPGTEGTDSCNFGRLCGELTVKRRRAGDILIGEGLAEPYHCHGTSCPRRRDWCR